MPIPPSTAGDAAGTSRCATTASGPTACWVWAGRSMASLRQARCRTLRDHFGYVGKVALDLNDRYCLDDRPLVGVSGTYGATAEYRTEIDSFSRIKSTGSTPRTVGCLAGGGQGGQILPTAPLPTRTSRARAQQAPALGRERGRRPAWQLLRRLLTNTATGEHYREIRYTAAAATLTPYAAVRFEYGPRRMLIKWCATRAASSRKFSSGSPKVSTWMDIASDGTGGTLVQELRISYQTSATNKRSLQVSSVQWCGPSNQCLPGTTFACTRAATRPTLQRCRQRRAWNGPTVSFEAGDSQTLDNALKSVQVR